MMFKTSASPPLKTNHHEGGQTDQKNYPQWYPDGETEPSVVRATLGNSAINHVRTSICATGLRTRTQMFQQLQARLHLSRANLKPQETGDTIHTTVFISQYSTPSSVPEHSILISPHLMKSTLKICPGWPACVNVRVCLAGKRLVFDQMS